LSNYDGLWSALGRTKIFSRPRVPLQLVGGFTWLQLVLSLDAILSHSAGRRRPFDLVLVTEFADLVTMRRRRAIAFHEAVLPDFARRGLVALDNILPHFPAFALWRMVMAADKAHLRFVDVFFKGPVGKLVALDGVAAAAVARRGGLPVAVPLTVSNYRSGHTGEVRKAVLTEQAEFLIASKW